MYPSSGANFTPDRSFLLRKPLADSTLSHLQNYKEHYHNSQVLYRENRKLPFLSILEIMSFYTQNISKSNILILYRSYIQVINLFLFKSTVFQVVLNSYVLSITAAECRVSLSNKYMFFYWENDNSIYSSIIFLFLTW